MQIIHVSYIGMKLGKIFLLCTGDDIHIKWYVVYLLKSHLEVSSKLQKYLFKFEKGMKEKQIFL